MTTSPFATRVEDRKITRLNSSHTVIYTLSLHDALPIYLSDTEMLHTARRVVGFDLTMPIYPNDYLSFCHSGRRSEDHTSELQSHSDLHSFPTRRSSDLP